jgi:galactokinase
MTESHASSRTLLGNSTPMLDQLVELALGIPGCLGARLTGAGFGGAIVSLVSADAGDTVVRELPARFQERTGRPVTAWRLRPAGGAV